MPGPEELHLSAVKTVLAQVCVSAIFQCVICVSMYKVSRIHWPGSGGPQEVSLRDGICGVQALVYFPQRIPVLPAGFSQVLALIRLRKPRGEERRGIYGLRTMQRGRRLRRRRWRFGERSVTALESVTHNWAQLKTCEATSIEAITAD